MGITETLRSEQENKQSIILYKEGMFWKSYEHSAYLFCKHIREYRVLKKFYKICKCEVVSLGFPESALEGHLVKIPELPGEITERTDKIIRLQSEIFDIGEYGSWKDSLELVCQSESTKAQDRNSIQGNPLESDLRKRIIGFPVIQRTPMEAQAFIVELQLEINGQI